MKSIKSIIYTGSAIGAILLAIPALGAETYGLSFSGTLALPENFEHLPYVNPEAQKGGRIVYAEYGTYDAFSPYIAEGKTPFGFGAHIYESFFIRSVDESFSLYCLLCEKIDVDDDRTYIEFWLRPEAKFSDGTPISIDDVMWSYQTLGEKGAPKYGRYMAKVTNMEKTGDNSVKFTLTGEDRELPLLLGMMPIMKKADFEGKDFAVPSDQPTIGSGAYVLGDYKMGEYISFKRNPDYWGKDLPVTKGLWNLDEIKYVYYADPDAMFEAVKAGDVNYFLEGDPKRWASYDFPAFTEGKVVKESIKHQRPAGFDAFVFNMRRKPFDDWRVREALIAGFNFPFVNQTINDGAYPRIDSYYTNSYLAASHGPAEGAELALLQPFAAELPPGALDGYTLPAGDVSGRDREGVAHAMELMTEAGFKVENGVMKDAEGKPFTFSVLAKTPDDEKLANLWQSGLDPLGIKINIETVDAATYTERVEKYDYDVMHGLITLSLSPGNEQIIYWGSESADKPATRNYSGLKSPAVDAVIQEMISARDTETYKTAVHALDRLLLVERIGVPFWYNADWNTLHDAKLHFPSYHPIFGIWPGYQPDAMYWEE